ncbi:MAG TPA: hypothetical protein VKG45_08510 [Actinomycetes bacterium]|nr:hypothetical protein [Actinomycetes bacterium]
MQPWLAAWSGRPGGVRAGLVAVVRLLAAVVLIGSVLLIVALVGQAMAVAQELVPADARIPAPAPAAGWGRGSVGDLSGPVPGPLTGAGDVTARLVQAQRVVTAAQMPQSADVTGHAAGSRAPDTPGAPPGVPPPAWGQVPLPTTKFQVVAALEGGERAGGDDGPVLPPGTMTLAAHTQPPGQVRDLQAGARQTYQAADTLAQRTQMLTAIKRDLDDELRPAPELATRQLVEPAKKLAVQAWVQATRNPHIASAALIGAATSLSDLAAWSDLAASVLAKDAKMLTQLAGTPTEYWRADIGTWHWLSNPPLSPIQNDTLTAKNVSTLARTLQFQAQRVAGPLAPDLDQKLAAVDAALGITGQESLLLVDPALLCGPPARSLSCWWTAPMRSRRPCVRWARRSARRPSTWPSIVSTSSPPTSARLPSPLGTATSDRSES